MNKLLTPLTLLWRMWISAGLCWSWSLDRQTCVCWLHMSQHETHAPPLCGLPTYIGRHSSQWTPCNIAHSRRTSADIHHSEHPATQHTPDVHRQTFITVNTLRHSTLPDVHRQTFITVNTLQHSTLPDVHRQTFITVNTLQHSTLPTYIGRHSSQWTPCNTAHSRRTSADIHHSEHPATQHTPDVHRQTFITVNTLQHSTLPTYIGRHSSQWTPCNTAHTRNTSADTPHSEHPATQHTPETLQQTLLTVNTPQHSIQPLLCTHCVF